MRTPTAPPAAREGEQTAAQQRAGEALLRQRCVSVRPALAELVEVCVAPLGLAGGGADAKIAETVGARWLDEDPVTAAASSATPRGRRDRIDN